jgi:cytochrome c biogenesis protein CcdA
LGKNKFEKLNNLPTVDLIKHFLSFGIFAVLAAGLIDGINPCAFTVIVFFISFLAFQGYKKRELAAIGLSFICAVFLTYILIGLGLFRFLYSLHKFYLVTRIVYYFIAVLCFILGALAIYDIWIFLKTRQTDGLTLQLPQVVKNRIHSIIGMYYRKSPQEKLHVGSQRHFMRLVASAFLTGFLVSLLEAVCTGQLYLPTITLILKEASLRLRAFGYLLLYNFMFIIPLGLVLVFALLGTTSEGFARVMKKNIVVVKLLMALLFLGLGLVILKGI